MKLSAEIKKHFRKIGIPVRVRTVAVKHPFCQVWIETVARFPQGAPIYYEHEFPVAMRQKLLRIIYGDGFAESQKTQGCSDSSAGNVNSHSFSCSEAEWRELTKEENAATITQ